MTQIELTKYYRLVEQAIKILSERSDAQITHGGPEPSLTELASVLNTSASNLQRVFREWAGISPKQFFQCLQTRHALDLINSGHSTLSASAELGFASTSKLHNLTLKFEALTPGEIKSGAEGQIIIVGQTDSPLGQVFLALTPRGINSLEFETPSLHYDNWREALLKQYPKAIFKEDPSRIGKQVTRIFGNQQKEAGPLALHVHGTPFQLKVWQALMHIPPAHFASYQQIARLVGQPTASRAVGSAIAKNPVGYLIPCHRVIQSTGHLGQYRWDSTRKKALHLWEQGRINA